MAVAVEFAVTVVFVVVVVVVVLLPVAAAQDVVPARGVTDAPAFAAADPTEANCPDVASEAVPFAGSTIRAVTMFDIGSISETSPLH